MKIIVIEEENHGIHWVSKKQKCCYKLFNSYSLDKF